jgi:chorismate mutase/prephenate dehydratase
MENLEKYRNLIDKVDKKIIDCIIERYSYVKEIGEIKKSNNLPIYVPEREKALLEKLENYAAGKLAPQTLRAIYKEIISGAIRLENPLTIAFLGPLGTFSHQAVVQNFGHGVKLKPLNSIGEAISVVQKQLADYACIPVENSVEGVVNQTLDTLRSCDLRINSEFYVKIEHNLIGYCKKEEIKYVYSHPQVLGQCRNYIASQLPQAQCIESGSSALALEMAKKDKYSAAIGSVLLAQRSEVPIIEHNIEDNANTRTRFINISPHSNKKSDNNKTSICFTLKNESGALYQALKYFYENNISMSLIESRPFPPTDYYCFFVDFIGYESDKNVVKALDQLKKMTGFFKILGSYPSA